MRRTAGPAGLSLVLLLGLSAAVLTTQSDLRSQHDLQLSGAMPMVEAPRSMMRLTAPELDRSGWLAWSPPKGPSAAALRAAQREGGRVLDGRPGTAWRSTPATERASRVVREQLRTLTIDTRGQRTLSALQYVPDESGAHRIALYDVRVSRDDRHWTLVTRGRWADDASLKTASFRPVRARYVRLTAVAVSGGGSAAASEIHLLGAPSDLDPTDQPTTAPTTGPTAGPTAGATTGPTSQPSVADTGPATTPPAATATPTVADTSPAAVPTQGTPGSSLGQWTVPIGLPLVPASAILLPHDKVLTFAGINPTGYSGPRLTDGTTGSTEISIIDLDSQAQPGLRQVADTHHEMFCTGLSILGDGRVVITGGSDAPKTTVYDPATDTFSAGPDMNVPRGYQSSVTLSDGRLFVIGGSWVTTTVDKVAEILSMGSDGSLGTWSELSNVSSVPIMTDDSAGQYRADNHAWLFAGPDASVFQAGPSSEMHWIDTAGQGSITDAGPRGDSLSAMNGNAVMYDIGKILTLGGAQDYGSGSYSQVRNPRQYATSNAYTIDISGGPGTTPVVTPVGPLNHARTFSNSVVLPDGEVLTTGGQGYAIPFGDNDSVLTPEIWSPVTGEFTDLAPAAIPRNYHSFSLLLPDGRVMAGGGGLCNDCGENHPNVEIFTPPYLLNADGTPRIRPAITGTVPTTVSAGSTLTVQTNRPVTSFALVRTGSATHSIDTDQRRIPLQFDGSRADGYRLSIPSDRGVVVPGPYLLFALDKFGTPSVARWVDIP